MKAVLAVERDGVVHGSADGVEPHVGIANGSRFGEDAIDELASEVVSAGLWTDIETLHLADAMFRFGGISDGVKRDAAGRFVIYICQQQTARWRSVIAGKIGEFGVKALEAQIEVEGVRVFLEQSPRMIDSLFALRQHY